MRTEEVVALMREHAALLNLEAEVINALKAYQVGHQEMLNEQIQRIVISLQRVEEVRTRNKAQLGEE